MNTSETTKEVLEEFDEKFAPEWNYRHVVNADKIKDFIKNSHIKILQNEVEKMDKLQHILKDGELKDYLLQKITHYKEQIELINKM